MIEKKDIIAMVRHIAKRDRGVADSQIMHPAREWFLGLSVGILLIILGGLFSMRWFVFYDDTVKSELTTVETVVPYKAAVVEAAILKYQARQAAYQAIVGTNPRQPAPESESLTDLSTSTAESQPEILISEEGMSEIENNADDNVSAPSGREISVF